jgi:hypothetical protein
MATVRAFSIPGLKLWFYSNDHEPPHFHAKRAGEWEARVWFLLEQAEMIDMVWEEKRPANRTLKLLTQLAEEHRLELLEEWEEIQQA